MSLQEGPACLARKNRQRDPAHGIPELVERVVRLFNKYALVLSTDWAHMLLQRKRYHTR